jgi:serine/threonine-protein kinase
MPDTVAPKMPTAAPQVKLVGRYSVLRELRRERYTTVYLAFDPVLNRELVVKAVQLRPSQSQDRAAHERVEQAFMRQAQAAGRLHHPNIVTVFDAGHVNQIGYLALEKVDGKLLDELLGEGFRPGFLQAADIVARVADAVEFAHGKAVPHGHLSPSRIYLQGTERTPKVMGFGGWIDSGATGDFELAGTDKLLPYFGDELSGEARRKDVRALGALLYTLLTGTRPDVKTLRERGRQPESPILQQRPNAPLALAEIAEQALELGGTRVYATAAQVRNALTTFLWGNRGDMPLPGGTITGMPARLAVMPRQSAPLTVATVTTPATARRDAPSRRRRGPMLGLAAGVALVLIAGAWVRTQWAPPAVVSPPPAAVAAAASNAATTAVASSAPVPGEDGGSTASAEPAPAAPPAGARNDEAPRVRPAARGAATAQGVVALAIAPWGTVLVDGEPRGTSPPLTQLTLPAGRHTIEIRNGDQTPYIAQVDVTPERPAQIRHRFQ